LYTNGVQYVLPTPANVASYPSAINDSNQIAGYMFVTNPPFAQQAFFYDGTEVKPIGGFGTNFANPGSVYGVNKSGQVVGVAYDTNITPHAYVRFVYDTVSVIADLNTMLPAGWLLGLPTGINDAGQIIGVGTSNLTSHGVLLTPALVFNPSAFKVSHGGTVT